MSNLATEVSELVVELYKRKNNGDEAAKKFLNGMYAASKRGETYTDEW